MAVIAKVLSKMATGQPSVNIPVFVGIQIINTSRFPSQIVAPTSTLSYLLIRK